MALKHIGRSEYLGSNKGGQGYFVKYCPECNEKIYLMENGELEEFLLATYVPRIWKLIKNYFKLRLWFPKIQIHFEWQNNREFEIVQINERIKLTDNKSLVMFDPKKFSRTFFDKKYASLGGFERLEKMLKSKCTLVEIGDCFGFSRQYAFHISRAFNSGNIID